jgi:MSHA biogenesis protein MshO
MPTGVQTIAVGDQIVVFNLGPTYVPADAYNCTGFCNRAAVTGVNAGTGTITINSNPFALQVPRMRSPSNRFQVVTTPVTYVCANRQLIRYWGYPIQTAQPSDTTAAPLIDSGTRSALLATDVATCNFTSNVLATRNSAMVELQITMGAPTSRSGAIQLVHQVLVDNTP